MVTQDSCCTLSPNFKVPPANLPAFKALCERFVAQTYSEAKCLFYGFCFDGDMTYCREGYLDTEGLLLHLDHVGPLPQ